MIDWRTGIRLARERAVVTVPGPHGPLSARLVYWPLPSGTRGRRSNPTGNRARVELPGGARRSYPTTDITHQEEN